MPDEKKETAEKKLLKIIENPTGGQTTPAPEAAQLAAAVKASGMPALSLPSFLGPLSDLLHGKISFAAGSALSFGLKEANYVLSALIAVMFAIFVFSMVTGTKSLENRIAVSVDAKAVSGMDSVLPQPKDVEQYVASIAKRNIFQPFEKKIAEEITVESETAQITTLTKNLKLVGISWLDSPESATALIEDTQSGMTYFVKMGEKVNNITVKSIYADRIILTYQDEDLTIKL